MIAPTMFTTLADANNAASVMHAYVTPMMQVISVLASLFCVIYLVNGGFQYMTSAGRPENLDHAKKVIRNALIGLVLVLGAAALTLLLNHAYNGGQPTPTTSLPQLSEIKAAPVSNGLVDVLIKAITGLLNNIIQSVAAPFLAALSYFTKSTPMMAENSAVFNLWVGMVGIADALFVIVIALLGFKVMSASTFGFEEIEFKHLLPRVGLIFLLVNCSIFAIDAVIELSNALIKAINAAGNYSSVWDVLTNVVKDAGGQGVAALLLMLVFLIFSIILLVYYVGRYVTLFIGAVLSPIVFLLWLIPGFRDFSESAMKTYVTTIFVLFVHVVILQLAASLFAGMSLPEANHAPDTLMAMVVGLATLIALLKTQGMMMQFSYASIGPRTARQLGSQFINGVSYLGAKGKGATTAVTTSSQQAGSKLSSTVKSRRTAVAASVTPYRQPKTQSTKTAPAKPATVNEPKVLTSKDKKANKPIAEAKVAKPMEKME